MSGSGDSPPYMTGEDSIDKLFGNEPEISENEEEKLLKSPVGLPAETLVTGVDSLLSSAATGGQTPERALCSGATEKQQESTPLPQASIVTTSTSAAAPEDAMDTTSVELSVKHKAAPTQAQLACRQAFRYLPAADTKWKLDVVPTWVPQLSSSHPMHMRWEMVKKVLVVRGHETWPVLATGVTVSHEDLPFESWTQSGASALLRAFAENDFRCPVEGCEPAELDIKYLHFPRAAPTDKVWPRDDQGRGYGIGLLEGLGARQASSVSVRPNGIINHWLAFHMRRGLCSVFPCPAEKRKDCAAVLIQSVHDLWWHLENRHKELVPEHRKDWYPQYEQRRQLTKEVAAPAVAAWLEVVGVTDESNYDGACSNAQSARIFRNAWQCPIPKAEQMSHEMLRNVALIRLHKVKAEYLYDPEPAPAAKAKQPTRVKSKDRKRATATVTSASMMEEDVPMEEPVVELPEPTFIEETAPSDEEYEDVESDKETQPAAVASASASKRKRTRKSLKKKAKAASQLKSRIPLPKTQARTSSRSTTATTTPEIVVRPGHPLEDSQPLVGPVGTSTPTSPLKKIAKRKAVNLPAPKAKRPTAAAGSASQLSLREDPLMPSGASSPEYDPEECPFQLDEPEQSAPVPAVQPSSKKVKKTPVLLKTAEQQELARLRRQVSTLTTKLAANNAHIANQRKTLSDTQAKVVELKKEVNDTYRRSEERERTLLTQLRKAKEEALRKPASAMTTTATINPSRSERIWQPAKPETDLVVPHLRAAYCRKVTRFVDHVNTNFSAWKAEWDPAEVGLPETDTNPHPHLSLPHTEIWYKALEDVRCYGLQFTRAQITTATGGTERATACRTWPVHSQLQTGVETTATTTATTGVAASAITTADLSRQLAQQSAQLEQMKKLLTERVTPAALGVPQIQASLAGVTAELKVIKRQTMPSAAHKK